MLLLTEVVPLLLPAAVECVATCEVDLSDIWEGTAGDIVSKYFVMVPAADRATHYPSGSTGKLLLTVVAARALATLKQHVYSS